MDFDDASTRDVKEDDNDDDRKPPASFTSTLPDLLDHCHEIRGISAMAEEDDDDWSRRVETDELGNTSQMFMQDDLFRMESVVEDNHHLYLNHPHLSGASENHLLTDDEAGSLTMNSSDAVVQPVPSLPHLSLKERAVLRERQRRIETERARLKRQFALNNQNDSESIDTFTEQEYGERGAEFFRENGSVAEDGTLGEESTRAYADEESTSADQEKLGFNMERFLRNSDSFNPQLETTNEDQPSSFDHGGGVLMERFLSEPVIIQPDPPAYIPTSTDMNLSDVQRAVSFDVEGPQLVIVDHEPEQGAILNCFASSSCGYTTNLSGSVSLQVEDDEDAARDTVTPAASVDVPESVSDTHSATRVVIEEPRVLRLTEADMQEMAAIEEASIGNAPPSEREEEMLSEIGELAGFAPIHIDPSGNTSQDTPTTAQESASFVSAGNRSVPQVSEHGHGDTNQGFEDLINTQRFNAHILASHGVDGGIGPLAPSSLADNIPESVDQDMMPLNHAVDLEGIQTRSIDANALMHEDTAHNPIQLAERHSNQRQDVPMLEARAVGPIMSTPLASENGDGSFRDLPPEPWSPPGKMQVSPIPSPDSPMMFRTIGSTNPSLIHAYMDISDKQNTTQVETSPVRSQASDRFCRSEEMKLQPIPNMSIPPEIITCKEDVRSAYLSDDVLEQTRQFADSVALLTFKLSEGSKHRRHVDDVRNPKIITRGSQFCSLRVAIDNFFSKLSTPVEDASFDEKVNFNDFSIVQVLLERVGTLTVVLLFEIPTLVTVLGASDSLCLLIGQVRYQQLIGFIFVMNAISGSVGIHSSSLLKNVIRQRHLTPDTFMPWFWKEVGLSCCIGLCLAVLLGMIALFASGVDHAFGLTIAIAQFVSVLIASIVGMLAPFISSFVFQRTSTLWCAIIVTATQDVIAVLFTFYISKVLVPGFINSSNTDKPLPEAG